MIFILPKKKRTKNGFVFLLSIMLMSSNLIIYGHDSNRKTEIREKNALVSKKIQKILLIQGKLLFVKSEVFDFVKMMQFYLKSKGIYKRIENETNLRIRHFTKNTNCSSDLRMEQPEREFLKRNIKTYIVEGELNPSIISDIMGFLYHARMQEFKFEDLDYKESLDPIHSLTNKVYHDLIVITINKTLINTFKINMTFNNLEVLKNFKNNLLLLKKLCISEENIFELIHILKILHTTINVLSLELLDRNSFLFDFFMENESAFNIASYEIVKLCLKKIGKKNLIFYNQEVLKSKIKEAKWDIKQEIYNNLLKIILNINVIGTRDYIKDDNLSIFAIKKTLLNTLKKNFNRAVVNSTKNKNILNHEKLILNTIEGKVLSQTKEYLQEIDRIRHILNLSEPLKGIFKILDLLFLFFLRIESSKRLDLRELIEEMDEFLIIYVNSIFVE